MVVHTTYLDEREDVRRLSLEAVVLAVARVDLLVHYYVEDSCYIRPVRPADIPAGRNGQRKRCCYCLNTSPESPESRVTVLAEAVAVPWPSFLSVLQPAT